jgi:hypothetical protein
MSETTWETPLCPRCGSPTERAGHAAERLADAQDIQGPATEQTEERTADPLPESRFGPASGPAEGEALEREERAVFLAKPEEPEAFSLLGWSIALLIPFLNVLALFIAPFTMGLKFFMIAAGLVYVGVVIWYAAGTFPDPFAAKDAAMMTGFTTFALYFVALLHSWGTARRDVRARRGPAWRRSVERWEHLVYCDACAAVFLDDAEGAPVPVEKAPELIGATDPGGSAHARTPIWLWALLAAIAVGGGRVAVSWARDAVAEPEPFAPADPSMWEDIQTDPVQLDSAERPDSVASDSTGLDEPLLGPEAVRDTAKE